MISSLQLVSIEERALNSGGPSLTARFSQRSSPLSALLRSGSLPSLPSGSVLTGSRRDNEDPIGFGPSWYPGLASTGAGWNVAVQGGRRLGPEDKACQDRQWTHLADGPPSPPAVQVVPLAPKPVGCEVALGAELW